MINRYIAIDIGGTNIKSAIINVNGDIEFQNKTVSTNINFQDSSNDILNQVLELISELLVKQKKHKISGIGISTAGVVNKDLGTVIYAGPTIPGYQDTELKKEVEKTFGIACTVINDVNAAALGEFWLNNIETKNPIYYLTVGTGIGGAFMVNNKLIEGYSGTAGEVGYIPVENEVWQDIASTTSLIRFYKEFKEIEPSVSINGYDLFEAYSNNEVEAKLAIDKFVLNFSKGLLSIIYSCNPEYIVIGGGIFERGNIIIPLIKKQIDKYIQSEIFEPKDIIPATNGNKASMIGAVKYLIEKNKKM